MNDFMKISYLGIDPSAAEYDAYQDSITERVEEERQELYASNADLHHALMGLWQDHPRKYADLYQAIRDHDNETIGMIISKCLDEQITINAKEILKL